MDAKQQFIEAMNEWVANCEGDLKKEIERLKNRKTECPFDYNNTVSSTVPTTIMIDGIDVKLHINYMVDKKYEEYTTKFSVETYDTHFKEVDTFDEQGLYFLNGDIGGGIVETIEELYDLMEMIKNAKYCKIQSNFLLKQKKSYKIDNVLRGFFNVDKKCSVCMDDVGDGEKLICSHFCCRQCRHEMLRKKDKKCPLCRKKTVNKFDVGRDSDNE
jgi:hypothetical protein